MRAAALLALIAVSAAALGHELLAFSSPTASAPLPATSPSPASSREAPEAPPAASAVDPPRRERRSALGIAGGAVPDGTGVFDGEVPGVAKLDSDLLRALRQAAAAAAADGVELTVDSGWRSPEYQAKLLREAVAKYGSEAEAARWVATPETSAHVSGDAVDIGPEAAMAWLADRGATYGLCRTYANEPWHYELRPDAAERGCPPPYADPTRDPRMQR